jgi:hypothetical protein
MHKKAFDHELKECKGDGDAQVKKLHELVTSGVHEKVLRTMVDEMRNLVGQVLSSSQTQFPEFGLLCFLLCFIVCLFLLFLLFML